MSDILGIAGIIIGVITSIYFYLLSRRSKEPNWSIQSNNLIQGYGAEFDELEILYKKQKIENLTVSKIVFWNGGAETINGQDIAKANPIRVVTKNNAEILDISLLSTNNEPCQITSKLAPDKKAAYIEFDYLDKGNGAIFQVTHTGTSSQDVFVEGTVKGSKGLTRKNIQTVWLPLPTPQSFDKKLQPSTRRFVSGILWLIPALAVLGLVIYQLIFIISRDKAWSTSDYLIIGLGIILFIIGAVTAVNRMSGGPPRGLEAFEQDQ